MPEKRKVFTLTPKFHSSQLLHCSVNFWRPLFEYDSRGKLLEQWAKARESSNGCRDKRSELLAE
jgi:hypothetical protein